jgi:hypothetical protein
MNLLIRASAGHSPASFYFVVPKEKRCGPIQHSMCYASVFHVG